MTPRARLAPALQLGSVRRTDRARGDGYPFSVPVVQALDTLEFTTPVTFFVGENGSGKSTVLESIAAAAQLPSVGPSDPTMTEPGSAARALASAFRFTWGARSRRGFFLRAEDFFGFVRSVAALRAELRAQLRNVDVEFADASDWTRALAGGPARSSLAELERRYGADFDANSHGEQFLLLFRSRFTPGGLYLMDEPEAALSPQSQLGLLAQLLDMVESGSQLIVATHSPILLALPGATIVSFDESPPRAVDYASLPHVTLTRDFLNHPEHFLRHLR